MNDTRIIPPGEVLPPIRTLRSAEVVTEGKTVGKKGTGRTRGRFQMLNSFADFGARHVNTTAQACWWVLFRETKPDGLVRVSQSRVAECIGRSRVTVARAISQLQRKGLLTVVRQGGLTEGTSTFRLTPTPIARRAPT